MSELNLFLGIVDPKCRRRYRCCLSGVNLTFTNFTDVISICNSRRPDFDVPFQQNLHVMSELVVGKTSESELHMTSEKDGIEMFILDFLET